MAMLNALLITSCGVALGVGMVIALLGVIVEYRAIRRIRRLRREQAEDVAYFTAWARGEQARGRAEIARLRHTADAYGLHVPQPSATEDGDDNTRETKGA